MRGVDENLETLRSLGVLAWDSDSKAEGLLDVCRQLAERIVALEEKEAGHEREGH